MKLVIGIPAYRGQIDLKLGFFLSELSLLLARGGAELLELEDLALAAQDVPSIDRARNNLIENSLAAGADWLAMIDSDCYPERSGDFLRMVLAARDQKPALCAPACLTRMGTLNVHEQSKIIGADGVPDMGEMLTPERWNTLKFEFETSTSPTEGKLVPVTQIGFAMVLVGLGWFRKRWPEGPWCQSLQGPRGQWLSEDYRLCRDVSSRGGRVVLDPRFLLTHKTGRGDWGPEGPIAKKS